MPQCQFMFSVVFVFQKSYTGNILKIGRNKSWSSYLPDTKTESKRETEEGQEAAAPWGGAAYPWPRWPVVWAPWTPSAIAPSPINSLHRENPRARTSIHKKYCKPLPSSTRVWEGPEALPGTLPERGIITRGLLYRHACLRSDAWVDHPWTMGP
jgi:hypothetical protein